MTRAPAVADRPKCPACGVAKRPRMRNIYRTEGSYREADLIGREWTGTYRGYGAFCSLKCCEIYANYTFDYFGLRYRLIRK